MSERIDELMRISDRGFVDEYDDIKVILNNFLNHTMSELKNALPVIYTALQIMLPGSLAVLNLPTEKALKSCTCRTCFVS